MSNSLPQPSGSRSQTEPTSNAGYYVATLVVGVLGFVLGNLALDAVRELMHHNSPQASLLPTSSVAPIVVAEPKPMPRTVPLTAPISSALLPTESQRKLVAEHLPPDEPFGKPPAEAGQLDAVTLKLPPPPAMELAGPIGKPNLAIGNDSVQIGDSNEGDAIRVSPKAAEAYCRRGIASEQKGSYDKAIAELTEAIQLDPTMVDAYFGRGIAFGHKGVHDRAIADFDQAIRLNSSLAAAYYGRGCAYWYHGQKAKAQDDFAKAKRLGYAPPAPGEGNFIQMSLSALSGLRP